MWHFLVYHDIMYSGILFLGKESKGFKRQTILIFAFGVRGIAAVSTMGQGKSPLDQHCRQFATYAGDWALFG